MLSSFETLYLFRFNILDTEKTKYDVAPGMGVEKALHLLSNGMTRQFNCQFPLFSFSIGQNIPEVYLKTIFKDFYTISNCLFQIGYLGGNIIYEPDANFFENRDAYINISFGYEHETIWNLSKDDEVYSACLADFGVFDTTFSSTPFVSKYSTEEINSHYKATEYLGFAPILVHIRQSEIFKQDFNPNGDFLSIIKTLGAKTIDEAKYELLKNQEKIQMKQYWSRREDFTQEDYPRMCEECRDVGSCLGIRECGFM